MPAKRVVPIRAPAPEPSIGNTVGFQVGGTRFKISIERLPDEPAVVKEIRPKGKRKK